MTVAQSTDRSAEIGLLARFLGVIFSPQATFEAVVARPRWFGMLAVVLGLMAAGSVAFFSTEVGQQALLDQQVRSIEAFGTEVNDQMYERLQGQLRYAPYFVVAQTLVGAPLFLLIIAGILYAVFNAGLGGEASFRQLFAVVSHVSVLGLVYQIFTLPLNYARESISSPTNLAVFLPMLEEGSFAARLLGTIDLFFIWWILVLAIGLSVLYRRRTQPIAFSLFATYAVIALAVATFLSWRSGASL